MSSSGVKIEARAAAGLYYGAMTAAQLLSEGTSVTLAGMHVEDYPRFKWRGLMLAGLLAAGQRLSDIIRMSPRQIDLDAGHVIFRTKKTKRPIILIWPDGSWTRE